MAAKMGRPIIGKPKDYHIKIRLDEDMKNNIIKYGERHNMNRTEVIRYAIKQLLESEEK